MHAALDAAGVGSMRPARAACDRIQAMHAAREASRSRGSSGSRSRVSIAGCGSRVDRGSSAWGRFIPPVGATAGGGRAPRLRWRMKDGWRLWACGGCLLTTVMERLQSLHWQKDVRKVRVTIKEFGDLFYPVREYDTIPEAAFNRRSGSQLAEGVRRPTWLMVTLIS